MNLANYLADRKDQVDQFLGQWMPNADKPPERLSRAIRYSMLEGGGKRIRPILALASAEAVGGAIETVMPFAGALECIHTYSLIHDDLPAMDDDDMRRGQPTCHRAFDEATAILAGDALLTMAFEWLAMPIASVDPVDQLSIIQQLAKAAGLSGMVGGQMMDILSERRAVDLVQLQNIHIHKTGALIRMACVGGARLAGGSSEQVYALKRYGEAIGLAFQIVDDILDEIGDSGTMGKPVGADRKKAKATYPALLGLPQAQQEAQRLVEEAMQWLQPLPQSADPLRFIAQFIVSRTY